MKRFGVLLAVLVLFATLSVGTGVVGALNYQQVDTGKRFGTAGLLFPYIVYYNNSYWAFYFDLNEQTGQVEFLFADNSTMTVDLSTATATSYAGIDDNKIWMVNLGDLGGKRAVKARFVNFNGDTLITTEFNDVIYASNVILETIGGSSNAPAKYVGNGSIYAMFTHIYYSDVQQESLNIEGQSMQDWNVYVLQDADGTIDIIENPSTNGVMAIWVISPPTAIVTFDIKDGLTGQSITGVTVKENGQVLGTLDDGGSLELTKGTHTLTFEKSGYWSETVTIDVQQDMSVSVEMYPSSAAFKLENFPANISIPENTIYTLTFTLSPIDTSATYNTYLSLSGLSNVLEVRKDGQTISPESRKYYLGDISSPTQVSIKFRAGSVGTHGFTITLTSNDAIMSKTYTTTKQVTYTVEPLPFSVQMPSEWQVGTNELRISESSGQSYLITAVLKDSQGNEVWSDSYAFSPYEAHTFSINVPSEGSYTLELQWNGQTAVYDITVNPAITLVTKTLTVEKGGEGVITLHFKNPSSSVQYYTIKVSGGFLPAEINQSISVAPLAEKDVSIAFAVPEDLTYDAYELNVAVYQGDSVVFQDKVAVTIGDSGGFTLFGGGTSTSTWAYALLGLLMLGGLVFVLSRRR